MGCQALLTAGHGDVMRQRSDSREAAFDRAIRTASTNPCAWVPGQQKRKVRKIEQALLRIVWYFMVALEMLAHT